VPRPPPGPALRICLLGGLRLLQSGRALKFSAPARAASLLAYLIVHREQQMSRDAIAFAFWPDDDEPRARANLRRHLALIAGALPGGADRQPIVADNRSIRWNPLFPCTLDVAEFERLSAASDRAADAAALYLGDLLPTAYDEWILPERERLRSMHSTNLERLTERYASAGDYASAIATTRALLLHDPWREDALRTLLALRHASGDRAGALQEYESFAQRLRRDLDVAPMPETVRRYESILHSRDPAGERPASSLERLTAPATMPFVGRSEELLRLRQMWARAMRGLGGVAIVSGEAGIGKSRLITEFGATVVAQGGTIVAGAATFPEAMPYQAVIQALRSALPSIASLSLDPTWLAAAADVLPDLRDGDAALPRLPALEPDRQQDRLFEAIWHCFEMLARTAPVLLVFEDIHWAGPATIDLLAYLARRTRNHSIVVVVTCRDDETDAARPLSVLRHALRRSGAFTALPLGGFTVDEVAFVVSGVLAGPYEGALFAKRAHDVCSGNPFFLAEIVRDCLAAPVVLTEPPLPLSVATSIEGRVGRLSAEAQSLARIAAVVGRAFTVEIVAAAAGTSEAIGVRCMDELLDARLIREANDEAERGGDFVFAHDLVRAQLYARIPETLRRRLHRRVGFVLETLHAQEREALAIELARHFDEGLEVEKAAAAYLTSARQALRLYADGEALRALSRAAELTGDPELRYRAVSLREEIHGRAGRRTEQLADLETLEALADAAADESCRLDVMRRRIVYARTIDDVAGQQQWIAALRGRITSVQHRYWSAFCNEASAALLTSLGRYDEALSHAREAVLEYKEAADDAGIVRALCQIADVSALRDDPATAQVALDDATAIAVASSNEASIVRALATSALAAYMAADYESARIPAERGLELCRTIGDREGEADFLFRLGNIAGRRFSVGAAVTMYASATAIYDALNKPLGQAIVLLNTGLLYLKIGEHAQALGALKRARSVFAELNDLRGLTVCALNLGMAAYLRGRFGAALRISQKAVALAHRLGSAQLECTALGNVGAAERELGQSVASVAHSEAALDMRRRIAPMDIGSDLADMGLTYLRAGDLRAACAIAQEIEALPAPALESVMFPQNVLWSAAQIYAAAQLREPYARALQRAIAMRDERCAKIPEGPWRDTYRLLFFNRELYEAQAQHSDAFRTAGSVRSGA
jgi:DNA-binding SARP family transcriptional activator/predicted ATPase